MLLCLSLNLQIDLFMNTFALVFNFKQIQSHIYYHIIFSLVGLFKMYQFSVPTDIINLCRIQKPTILEDKQCK